MKIEKVPEEKKIILSRYHLPEKVGKQMVYLKYEPAEYMCKEGEVIDYLLFMAEGNAKSSETEANGKTLLLCFYRGEGILGDVELAIGRKTAARNVNAISSVACIGIPLAANAETMRANGEFMSYLASELAQKLLLTSQHAATNSLHTLENRLCAYIDMVNQEGKIDGNLTEISELLGTSYRHLLRILQDLCKEQVMEHVAKSSYRVVDAKELKIRARDCFIL